MERGEGPSYPQFTHGFETTDNGAKSRFNPVTTEWQQTAFVRAVAVPQGRQCRSPRPDGVGLPPTRGGGALSPSGPLALLAPTGGLLHNRYRSVAFGPPASGGPKPFYLMSRKSLANSLCCAGCPPLQHSYFLAAVLGRQACCSGGTLRASPVR